ncbi:UNVERIFIED_CONTAM: hypothetical protein Slati_1910900 [Sesamum latifolium]|uniref:Reverse transcriptase domain-containing protein n=1 Tax=Sesamum latifolium TaxID=2727402 RepID=A0AAW2X2R0_9LAMI
MNRATTLLNHQLTIEEEFWKQKSACKWVSDGERNTRYFHSLLRKKRAHTTVKEIYHDGQLLTDKGPIQNSVMDFFRSLLSSDQHTELLDGFEDIPRLLSAVQSEALCAPPTMEELHDGEWRCLWLFSVDLGFRQGDPLSPTLFLLAAEYLSRGLNKLFGNDSSLAFRGSQGISHLAYADDYITFTNSKESSLLKLKEFLDHFEEVSVQSINVFKSSFVIAPKAPALVIRHVKRITGFVHKPLPFTYLSTPIYVGRKKAELFNPLLEALTNKIAGWEKKVLSYGGRLLLIQSVLSSIPIHLLYVLKPPKGILLRIERLFNNFFWGSYGSKNRIHWSSWSRLSAPLDEGGLCIRRLDDVVVHFLANSDGGSVRRMCSQQALLNAGE